MFDDTEIRFRCLDLAARFHADNAVKLANEFYAFVTAKDQRNVRSQVLDALNQAGVD